MRIGAVMYLNSCPLVAELPRIAPEVEIVFDVPSRLAQRLAAGELDAGLVPSIEVYKNPYWQIVSDACIACRGQVKSVKLFSRVPIPSIQLLALDEGSRTSAVLAQILLYQRYGVRPRLTSLPLQFPVCETSADGVVLIGDRAMQAPEDGFCQVWDLGEEWVRWTGLPMVFALWAARPEADLDRLDQILRQSRDTGLEKLSEIARREALARNLTEQQCLEYFQKHLVFILGEQEKAGLRYFYELARQYGFLPCQSGDRLGPAQSELTSLTPNTP
ncbi:MAG: menaquinone biosynthesis protein [Thermoguttaceae bacterium]|nr:menaquinone biosynthesis protein [Thermoguttaceae bacterium]MDW8038373.1 menaquinone biosynthesis protein [Thermoguttaceae bacterium]